jgi:hypothetical protein
MVRCGDEGGGGEVVTMGGEKGRVEKRRCGGGRMMR